MGKTPDITQTVKGGNMPEEMIPFEEMIRYADLGEPNAYVSKVNGLLEEIGHAIEYVQSAEYGFDEEMIEDLVILILEKTVELKAVNDNDSL